MNAHVKSFATLRFRVVAATVMLALVFILGCSKKAATTTAEIPQTTFISPSDAGQALLAAVQAKDESAIARVLGTSAKTLLSSGDPAADAAASESFASKYDRMNRWVAMTDGSQVLYIGADNYPFPIPLAKDAASKWYFNAAAGHEELKARRIGRNELRAMDVCRLIATAEELYRQGVHDGNPAHPYTDTIISTPGKQDGLYWEVAADQLPSPLGRLNAFAKGVFDSGAPGKTLVLDGYSFRILPAQERAAKGNSVAKIKTSRGFVVIASPVDYQHSGIMTFTLSDGVIYEQDLGPKTAELVALLRDYSPTDGSTPVYSPEKGAYE